jgi:hypothetical protein
METWAFPDISCSGGGCLITQNRVTIPAILIGSFVGSVALAVFMRGRRGLRGRRIDQAGQTMSTIAGPQTASAASERRNSTAITIVAAVIGLSVILSYGWGSAIPGVRSDAPNIVLLGILAAALVYLITAFSGSGRFRRRLCPTCGHGIPTDALFCPYCGHRFLPA